MSEFAFSKTLFETDKSTPMTFSVKNIQDAHELSVYIEYGGGHIDTSDEVGPYTIVLRDDKCEKSPFADRDIFHCNFIYQCCLKNAIVPLKTYRLNSTSVLPAGYDPNDVLFHNTTWQQACKDKEQNSDKPRQTGILKEHANPVILLSRRLPGLASSNHNEADTKTPKKVRKSKSSHSEVDECEVESIISSHSGSSSDISEGTAKRHSFATRSGTMGRVEYTQQERQDIVNYIVKVKGYNFIKGTAMWKRMSRKFPLHTWQSLKNHFLRRILPFIGSYGLSPQQVKYFKCPESKDEPHNYYPSGGRIPYTAEDDKKIANFVQKYGTPSAKISGNMFWQKAEKLNLIPGRSWQALRERYLKRIRPGLKSQGSAQPKEFQDTSKAKKDEVNKESRSGAKRNLREIHPALERPAQPKKVQDSNKAQEDEANERSENEPSVQGLKKRKLFTITDNLKTPSKDTFSFSPISARRLAGQKHVAQSSNMQKKVKLSSTENGCQILNGIISDSSSAADGSESDSNTQLQSHETSPGHHQLAEGVCEPSGSQQDIFASSNESAVVQPCPDANSNQVPELSQDQGKSSLINQGEGNVSQPSVNEAEQSPSNPGKGRTSLPDAQPEVNTSPTSLHSHSNSPAVHKESVAPPVNCQEKLSKNEVSIKWPSTFDAEEIMFVQSSQQSEVSESSLSEENISDEDGDFSVWSEDGLFWRGGIDKRDSSCRGKEKEDVRDVNLAVKCRPEVASACSDSRSGLDRELIGQHPPEKTNKRDDLQPNESGRECHAEHTSPSKPPLKSKSAVHVEVSQESTFNFLKDLTMDESTEGPVAQHINVVGLRSSTHSLKKSRHNIQPTLNSQNPNRVCGENSSANTQCDDNSKKYMVDVAVQTDPVQIIPIPIKDSSAATPKQKTSSACKFNPKSSGSTNVPSPKAADLNTRSAARKALRSTRSSATSDNFGVHSPKYRFPSKP